VVLLAGWEAWDGIFPLPPPYLREEKVVPTPSWVVVVGANRLGGRLMLHRGW